MSDKKQRYARFTTDIGTARYPYIDKPDGKFPVENPRDVYKVNLILAGEKTEQFIAQLQEAAQQKFDEVKAELESQIADAKGPAKKKLEKKLAALSIADVYEDNVDDAGEETGEYVLKFKLNADGKDKKGKTFRQRPAIFDASAPPKPLEGVEIWSGSRIRVSGEIVPYFMQSTDTVGVSLRMKAVQVIDLVTRGSANAAAYGFDGVDGGFTQNVDDDASDFDDDTGDDGDDDF